MKVDGAKGKLKDDKMTSKIRDEYPEIFELIENLEGSLRYTPHTREFGISVLDGGSSKIRIFYCPLTGKKLPASLSDQWFDRLDELGLEPEDAPPEMRSKDWWPYSYDNKAALKVLVS